MVLLGCHQGDRVLRGGRRKRITQGDAEATEVSQRRLAMIGGSESSIPHGRIWSQPVITCPGISSLGNDSNGLHVGCKLIRGMEDAGEYGAQNGVVCGSLVHAKVGLGVSSERLCGAVPCSLFLFPRLGGADRENSANALYPTALESIVNSPRDWRTALFSFPCNPKADRFWA